MFDEEPDGDPHGECAAEIERLKELADSEGTRAVEYLRRARKAEEENVRLRADIAAEIRGQGVQK